MKRALSLILLSLMTVSVFLLSSCEFLEDGFSNIIDNVVNNLSGNTEASENNETGNQQTETVQEIHLPTIPPEKPTSPPVQYHDDYTPTYGKNIKRIDKSANPVYEYWKSTLASSNQISAYNQLSDMVKNGKCSISPSVKISFSDMEYVYMLFRLDHPEFFWNGSHYSAQGYENAISSFDITPIYTDRSQISSMWQSVEKEAEKIISTIPDNSTDIEAEMIIYNWLVDNIRFDSTGKNAYSIYGALVDKKCVCEGFAEAFQYLCNRLGIPAISITGLADNSIVKENHKWNGVKIGGKWYMVDSTWGSTTAQPHMYFNESGYISETHTFTRDLIQNLPDFYDEDASYMNYYGLCFNEENFDEVFLRAFIHFVRSDKNDDIVRIYLKAEDSIIADKYASVIGEGDSRSIRDLIKTVNNHLGTKWVIYDSAFVLGYNYISFTVINN